MRTKAVKKMSYAELAAYCAEQESVIQEQSKMLRRLLDTVALHEAMEEDGYSLDSRLLSS